MSRATEPSGEPDLMLRPYGWQNLFIVWPICLCALALSFTIAAVTTSGAFGVSIIEDRGPSHFAEVFFPWLVIVCVSVFLLWSFRRRTSLEGSLIWLHGGILRSKTKLLVDLDEATAAHVWIAGGRYWYSPMVMGFLDANGDEIRGNSTRFHRVADYSMADQERLRDHLVGYVKVTGDWSHGAVGRIGTLTHPAPPVSTR